MNSTYKPVDKAYRDELKALAAQKTHVRIQYYSDINEFLTANAAVSDLHSKDKEEYLLLSSGEEIRLDRIVRIDNKPAPGYDEAYFKCDC